MSSKVIAGRYELIEKIGDGGMAVVYKAKCRLLNRYVALKILKPEFTKDDKFIENFRKESHAAASLSHPNIVSIYDVGQEGNINYIVMELIEGRPLSDIIKEEGKLDYRRTIDFAKQIATGLEAAHKKGIIHRDVKPHNILITGDGIAKIADFGIAKAMSTTTIVEATGEAIMGSVHYFSPEQARGSFVDEKSDLYSLGIVMYEMLTGEVPFDGDNPVAVALKHINETMEAPSKKVDGIPPNLEKIILKLTDKYQSNRYKDAHQVIEELDNIEFVTRMVGTPSDRKVTRASEEEKEALRANAKEEEGKKKRGALILTGKHRKMILIGAIIVGIAFIAIVVALIAGAFGRDTVTVPDVKGMTYAQATDALEEVGLKIEEGDFVFSEKYDVGQVVSQSPKEDSKVKKGATVKVNISKGATEGTVPNLIGKTESEAKKIIEKYDFKVGTVTEKTSTEKAGTVIEQDPKAGSVADVNSKINITISNGKGKEKSKVPNLLGLSEDEAKAAITDAGFSVGDISYENSDTYAKGKVMYQGEEAGSQLEEGTAISITVSKGNTSTVELYVSFDKAKQEVFYMTVTVTDVNGTRNIISNQQQNKSEKGTNLSIEGSGKGSVDIIFDGEAVIHKEIDFTTGEIT